jgi:hypothetical protein
VTGVSEQSLAEYVHRVIPSWWKNPEPPLDSVLFERAEDYFRRGLELLDALPRDDPFWDKTNNKATVFKASIWFRQVLEANPSDAEARSMLAALTMASDTGAAIKLAAPLVAENPSALRWMVDVTVWVWEQAGADYTELLRDELSVLQNDPAVRSLLQEPAGDDDLGRAIQVARSVLAGNCITVAI